MAVLPMIVIVMLGAMLLAGLAMLVRGVGGKRLNNHPHCMKCDFDLVGLYGRTADRRATHCPECGADLTGRHAVYVGRRERRAGLMVMGVLCVCVPVGLLMTWGVGAVANVSMVSQYPDWLLVWSIEHGTPRRQADELHEVVDRLTLNTFDASYMPETIERALEVQGDRSITWEPAWGDLIENARKAGFVSNEQMKTYMEQAAEFSLAVRSPVAADKPLPIEFTISNVRAGGSQNLAMREIHAVFAMNGLVVYEQSDGGGFSINNSGSSTSLRKAAIPEGLAGTVQCTGSWRITITNGYSGAVDCWVDIERSATVEVIPAGTPTVVHDDRGITAEQMRSHMSIFRDQINSSRSFNNKLNVNFAISMHGPPMAGAFEVFVRDRATDQEWQVGTIEFPAGVTNQGLGVLKSVPDFAARRVDVILRSSPEVAETTADRYEIWKGEVIFEDLSVFNME